MLTRQEIIGYASRYVTPDEGTDFPFEGDLFCLLGRTLGGNRILKEEEGWRFQGYGRCSGYTLDGEAKPIGKWVWMHFVSLAEFPPTQQTIRLQPPHVVRGRFQDPSRTREFRIIKIDMKKSVQAPLKEFSRPEIPQKGKLVPFRKKK